MLQNSPDHFTNMNTRWHYIFKEIVLQSVEKTLNSTMHMAYQLYAPHWLYTNIFIKEFSSIPYGLLNTVAHCEK